MPPKLRPTPQVKKGGSVPSSPTATNATNAQLTVTEEGEQTEENVSGGTDAKRQKGKQGKNDGEILCKGSKDNHCGKVVKDNADGGIECEVCLNWYHPACQGLHENAYLAIKQHDLFWLCENCKPRVLELRELVHADGDHGSKNVNVTDSACLARMEAKIDELSKAVKKQHILTSEIRAEDAEVRKTYADALKISSETLKISSETKPPEPLSTEQIQVCLSEQAEQEKRARNLAVYNLPESQAASAEERITEDISLLTDIVKQELKRSYKIEKAYRAGKKMENRPRTWIVTMESEVSKWDLLRAGNGLRDSMNETAKNVYINRDLTRREREQAKKVRDECNRRRNAGEHVRIYKGKCVVDTRNRSVAAENQPRVDRLSHPAPPTNH